MSEQKKTVKPPMLSRMYALSIHMKYGEVLHIEGLDKEEKDRYLALCRNKEDTLVVEDEDSVRHIHSTDIAKISVVKYDSQYAKIWHPVKKMFFAETSIGRHVFSAIIKVFFLLALIAIVGVLGMRVIDGTIMDVLFDGQMFRATVSEILGYIGLIFGYIAFAMVVLFIVDMILAIRSPYFINQDGAPYIEYTVMGNIFLTLGFFVFYFVAITLLGQMLLAI